MNDKTREIISAQLNLISCLYGIENKEEGEKMDVEYKTILGGLKKLTTRELEALNNVITAIKKG
jgi:hypothetical protein